MKVIKLYTILIICDENIQIRRKLKFLNFFEGYYTDFFLKKFS